MRHWLVKTEPGSYSWDDLVRDRETDWDGVRNHAAAGHLRAMTCGDRVLVYHSGEEKAAVGVAEVTGAAQPDGDDGWVKVRLAAVEPLSPPVTLTTMKQMPALKDMSMLRQSRLSVSPVMENEWAAIVDQGGGS